jgi:hypothetical protein
MRGCAGYLAGWAVCLIIGVAVWAFASVPLWAVMTALMIMAVGELAREHLAARRQIHENTDTDQETGQ